MRVVIQRVLEASVSIDKKVHSQIENGLLLLVGFEESDTHNVIEKTAQKIISLRIFNDSENKMNLSVKDIKGELLIVSQFTLFADTKKGTRPSFIKAAKPEIAIPSYEYFVQKMREICDSKIETGIFGADMKVVLINDGPVTILIDSNNPF